jgi:2-keto-3-deoxy-L-rhamnonate aldolase RhmA
MPQIEHGDAVEEIDAILSLEGIDCVMVGPFDLSASLGHPGALDHPTVVSAIRRVAQACERAGKRAGLFAASTEFAQRWQAEGFTVVAVGADVALLAEAARRSLGELREER